MAVVPLLNPGDTIAIVAPAKHIDKDLVDYAERLLVDRGYNVRVGSHCTNKHFYFSGTVEERLNDFQEALDDPSIKAILCARGGYGSVHIVDRLNWSSFTKSPKWVLGFSDITVFHSRLNLLGVPSVHSSVPLNFKENSKLSIDSLFQAISNETYSVFSETHEKNKTGHVVGEVVGGNLSILHNLLGTNDKIDYKNKILFIEDLCEHLYVIDRMLYAFKKADVFNEIAGLIVGGMTGILDTDPPFGQSIEDIVLDKIKDVNIPVAFEFPAGHIDDNRAIRFGSLASLEITSNSVTLSFTTARN